MVGFWTYVVLPGKGKLKRLSISSVVARYLVFRFFLVFNFRWFEPSRQSFSMSCLSYIINSSWRDDKNQYFGTYVTLSWRLTDYEFSCNFEFQRLMNLPIYEILLFITYHIPHCLRYFILLFVIVVQCCNLFSFMNVYETQDILL